MYSQHSVKRNSNLKVKLTEQVNTDFQYSQVTIPLEEQYTLPLQLWVLAPLFCVYADIFCDHIS